MMIRFNSELCIAKARPKAIKNQHKTEKNERKTV